jgi:hypothetical protein
MVQEQPGQGRRPRGRYLAGLCWIVFGLIAGFATASASAQHAPLVNRSDWWRNGATLDLDFVNNRYYISGTSVSSLTSINALVSLTGVTFTRNTSATYVDASGVLQTVGRNVPRLGWETSGTGIPLGLIIEVARANSLPASEDFTNAAWTCANCTVVSNTAIAPNGLMTADFMIPDNGISGAYVRDQFTYVSGTTYTYSVFVKLSSSHFSAARLLAEDSIFGDGINRSATFTLSGPGSVSVSGGGVSATIMPFPNGWYRIALTFTAASASTQWVQIRQQSGVTGNGIDGVYLWGAQQETGAYPTSYIATAGSTVTRADEDFSVSTTTNGGWLDATQGTLLAEGYRSANKGTTQNRLAAVNSTSGERVLMFVGSSPNVIISTAADGTTYSANGANPIYPAWVHMAGAYAANNFRGAVNDALMTLDTAGAVPVIDRLQIGNSANSTAYWDDWIGRITYFPTREPDHTLRDYTR